MTWCDQNQPKIEAIRKYVEDLQHIHSPVRNICKDGEGTFPYYIKSENGLRFLLLYHALKQNVRSDILLHFLLKCWQVLNVSIFRAGDLPFGDVYRLIQCDVKMRNWEWEKKFPGIVRSVGDYCKKYDPLSTHFSKKSHSEIFVNHISHSIFFMGKHSVMKLKARSLSLDILRYVLGNVSDWWDRSSIVPISPGAHRFLTKIGPLNGRSEKFKEDMEKLCYFNKFYGYLFPNQTWKVAQPLSSFQKKGEGSVFECEVYQGGCIQCSISRYCDKSKT